MKVGYLLEQLKGADPETEISFQMADGCCSDVEFLDIHDVDLELADSKYRTQESVTFYFNAPWFLSSCRRAGAAKRAAQEVIDSNLAWQKEQEEKSKK